MNFSINLNKIALLRDSRGSDNPSIKDYALQSIDLGVDGLTLHPRPDLRHAKPSDISMFDEICLKANKEFNIEGNLFSPSSKDYPGFISLVNDHNPHQVTLVPDADGQITSDHGWKIEQLDSIFKSEVSKFKKNITHVSIFIDDDFINFDKLNEIGINSVEIYTGPFAEVIKDGKKHEIHSAQNKISKIVESAKLNNLKVNAGHDLNLDNLPYLKECGNIDEVSIGHAIIVDSLKYGFKDTINMYIEQIKE